MKQKPSPLEQLAEHLVFNHLNLSLWDLVAENRRPGKGNKVYEDVLNSSHFAHAQTAPRPERNIVVVGAGASHNACNALLTGKATANAIRANLPDQVLLNREIKRLEQVYRLRKDDFETILYAISRFYSIELKEELYKRYNCRYHPNLSYEILAHLFKHRFVDVIINFNFDELLDQALADELSPGEYQRIISDGEYEEAKLFDEKGLRFPVYIKPHGTVSHKSSMRFTREDYFGLPADIEDAIRRLLNPKIGTGVLDDSEPQNEAANDVAIPVNIIVVGFDMQSFEFNLLLQELQENENAAVKFFFFKHSERDFFHEKEFPSGLQKYIEANALWIDMAKQKKGLDDCFFDLWKAVEKQYKAAYTPRNIMRHLLVSKIFESHERRQDRRIVESYLQDRTLVEFALSLAKYKGFICIEQLVSDRFGKYFNLFQRFRKKNADRNLATIPDYCALFNLKDYAYGRTAFYFADAEEQAKGALTIAPDVFMKSYCTKVYQLLLKKIQDPHTKAKLIDYEDLFMETMQALVTEQDIEISPVYENLYQNVFRKTTIVNTQLAFNYYTKSYVDKNNFDKLLIVAETGEWLLNLIQKGPVSKWKDKAIHMIIADTVREPGKKIRVKEIEVNMLRWWMHNQHMTVFLKREADKWRPVKAIYFSRRQRSTHINPIILDEPSDLRVIIESFGAYYQKALPRFDGEVPPNAIDRYLDDFIF